MDFYLTRVIVFRNFNKNKEFMKKLLFFIGVICPMTAHAQNYLISFAGAGASTTVSTVKVENLTKGTSLTLNGSDILQLTTVTGIKSIEDNQSSELKVYPNPMNDNATLEIFPPIEGNAIVSVYDMTGRLVAQVQSSLENSKQNFSLSGMKNGFYIINVKSNNYQFSGKLFSNGNSNGKISIEKVNSIIRTVDENTSKTNTKGALATVDMTYSAGDRLKFTGASGIYSTVMTDIPTSTKSIIFNFIACFDGDNNNYPIVEIGSQVWMAENLKTTKYSTGNLIGTTTPSTLDISGESTPRYQWAYDGNESNVAVYGRLYTWHAITDSRNACPSGWHVPTVDEWTILTTNLGGADVAGGKLKETGLTHWISTNTGVTNESGFTALPAGLRNRAGLFFYIGYTGYWWSATELDAPSAHHRFMGRTSVDVGGSNGFKGSGFSVRCIKD
jgi:uncharacterized protein (TIGR02145 family)